MSETMAEIAKLKAEIAQLRDNQCGADTYREMVDYVKKTRTENKRLQFLNAEERETINDLSGLVKLLSDALECWHEAKEETRDLIKRAREAIAQ